MAKPAAGSAIGLVVGLCFLACLCEGIDLQAAGVAAAGMRAEFHPNAAQLGYIFSASTLGLFIGAALGGQLADRLGRKPVLVASVAAFGVCSLLTATAWNPTTLIAWRLLTGVGLGGALPNLVALASESAPADRRSANVTAIYAGNPVGGAAISLMSMATDVAHWRWIFILGGVIPLLVAPLLGRLLPESPAFEATRVRPARVEPPVRNERGEDRSTGLAAVFGQGRAPRTLLLWISFLLALLTIYLLLSWLPTLLISAGLSHSQAAMVQIFFNLGGALGAWYVGSNLETRFRHVGILVSFLGAPCLLALLGGAADRVVLAGIIALLLGATALAAQATLYAYAPLCYPTRIRGTGVGYAVSMGRIGSIVGPLLGSALVGAGRNPTQVLQGVLPVVLIGSLCSIVLVWRRPERAGAVGDPA